MMQLKADKDLYILSDGSILRIYDSGRVECFMSKRWKKSASVDNKKPNQGIMQLKSKQQAIEIWNKIDEKLKSNTINKNT